MKTRKITFLLLLAVLCMASACSKNTNSTERIKKGRYVEKEFKLPVLSTSDRILSMEQTDSDLPILYVLTSKAGKIPLLQKITYTDADHYTSEEINCFDPVEVTLDQMVNIQFLCAPDHNYYFYFIQRVQDEVHPFCFQLTKQGSLKPLIFDEWDKKNADIPLQIGVLENGTILANTVDSFILYQQDGTRLTTFNPGEYDTNLQIFGNNVLLEKADGGGNKFYGLAIYNGSNLTEAPKTIDFNKPISCENCCSIDPAGDLYLISQDSISVLKKGTNVWSMLVDGSLNTMGLPLTEYEQFYATQANEFCSLYYSGLTSSYSLIQYVYDSSIDCVPSRQLSLYSLYKPSNTIYKAIHVFEQQHPDTKVCITAPMNEDEDSEKSSGLTKEDYIRSLNTELLSGGGYDLLVLDHLPMDSYIAKGVLEDLSDVIVSVNDSNALLPHVVQNATADGKIYCFPARIKVPLIYGKKEAIDAADSLSGLAAYANSSSDTNLLGPQSASTLIQRYLPYEMNSLLTAPRTIDPDRLKHFLSNIKTLLAHTQPIEKYDWEADTYYTDLTKGVSVILKDIDDLDEETFDLTFTDFTHGTYHSYTDAYLPVTQIGVNTNSQQTGLAKEFIAVLLSDSVQGYAMSDGVSVRIDSLLETKNPYDPQSYQYEYDDGSDTRKTLCINQITAEDRSQIIQYIKDADHLVQTDPVILSAILKGSENYYKGKAELDETVTAILHQLDLYSKEK